MGPEYATGAQEVEDGLRKVADELDGVDPPEDVARPTAVSSPRSAGSRTNSAR